jgi:hypothetical protein
MSQPPKKKKTTKKKQEITIRDAGLVSSNRQGQNWVSFAWKVDQLPQLKTFIEEQNDVVVEPGDVDFMVCKDKTLKYYLRSTYLAKLGRHLGISYTSEIMFRNLAKPIMYEVRVRGTLPGGQFVEKTSTCSTLEKGRETKLHSDILGMAETRATNRVNRTFTGMPTSSEEMQEKEGDKLIVCPGCGSLGFNKTTKKCEICKKSLAEIRGAKKNGTKLGAE